MKRKVCFAFLLFLVIIIAINCNAYARITTNDPTVTSGENVTIYISSQEPVNGGAINVVSNEGLEFVSVSGGEANGTLVAFSFTETKKSNIVSYVFKAPEVTETKKFKIVFASQDMSDENGDVASSQATATITVKPKEGTQETTKSNNANLKTLGVRPQDYDFTGFNKNKLEYESKPIPSSVNKLDVIATAEDSKAKVEVKGNTNLKVGTNIITVKVTAEDGTTTKEYTIKVTKLAEDEELPGNVIDDAAELFLTKLEIEEIDELSPAFAKDTYFYKAILRSDIDKVVINVLANNPNAKITITGNEDLKEGENTITIVVTFDGKVEQKVYQITLVKDLSPEEADVLTIGASDDDEKGGIERYLIIGALLIAFIIFAIIVLILLIRREKRKLMSYGDYDDDEEVEEVPPLRSRKYDQYDEDEDDEEEVPPLKSRRLYDQDKDEDYKKTIDEINAQTKSIFNKDEEVDGQSVEYDDEPPRPRRRGKH